MPAPLVRALAVILAIAACTGTRAVAQPADAPTRTPGLWLMERTGTIQDGKTAIEVQKIWHLCLDARADRALRKLEARERQAGGAGRFVTRMQHLGPCEAGLRPGDMMLMHWRVNGEETLKGRQRSTIPDQIRLNEASATTQPGR